MKMLLPKQLFVRSFFFFSFFLLLFLSGSLSNTEDSAALLAFKAGLSDSNQETLSSWVNTKDPCSDSWLGVTCNPVTLRVTRLVLEDLDLTGSFHPLSQLSQLRLLSLKNNSLLSSVSDFNFSSCPNLKLLYLSHNNLAGVFPAGIPHLRRLHRVDLSYNNFSGKIPMAELSQLPHLLTLRLEANSFTGTLDSGGDSSVSSSSSTILEFNVSDNRLSGQIPAWLSHFPASSFSGNEKLCGSPLELTCSNSTADKKGPTESAGDGGGGGKRKRLSIWVVVLVISIDAVAILAAIATVVCCCYYRKKRRDGSAGTQAGFVKRKGGPTRQSGGGGGVYYYGGGEHWPGEGMVVFEGCKGFGDVDDLLKSSAELLGKGSVGTTYKVAVMEGGDEETKVVVKRLRGQRKKRREVDDWLAVIGGLRHPHIASLRAYCNSKDELLLVYDFLPNGSLHSLLHGDRGPGRTPLDWTTRLRFAAGSAQGLAFLHAYNKAKLFHGNLTSSNIIVDHMGNACISDIGLHQLLHTPCLSNSSYRAPELTPSNNSSSSSSSQRNKYTQKCDVYSFGVILLEILTGKAPTGEGETGLVKWVQRVGRDEWTWEVFDFELVRYKEMEEEMVALMHVGLLCLAAMPRDRPKMSMVHRMIEDIRTKGGGAREGGPNSIMNDLSCDSSPSLSGNTTE